MTEIKHYPPQGQALFPVHTTNAGTCVCQPERVTVFKRSTTGRFGSSQGRTLQRIEWHHHFIAPVEEEEPGLHLVPSEAHYAAREDAWLAMHGV